MMKPNFDTIAEVLRNAYTVGVASHIRPDADALGSTIAFALWLRECGKEVTAYNEEGSTSKFHYLPCHEIVVMPPSAPQKFDVFVALDTSVKNRLGSVHEAIAPGTPILNIDHHANRGVDDSANRWSVRYANGRDDGRSTRQNHCSANR
jgi:phosphoesterase RecJ-like protein